MLSKTTEYAIRALIYIQVQNMAGERPLIAQIASENDTPPAFTAKIMQVLTRHNIVDAAKGRGGGFYFSGEQIKRTLYDIIVVMEGNRIFEKCGIGLKDCNNENPCPIHKNYKKVREGLTNIAKTETIESLSDKIKRGKAVIIR